MDRESGPLIRTPNPILTDRFVFASPGVWPGSAGTSRFEFRTTGIPQLVFINKLVQTKHNQTQKKKKKMLCNPNSPNNESFPDFLKKQGKPKGVP